MGKPIHKSGPFFSSDAPRSQCGRALKMGGGLKYGYSRMWKDVTCEDCLEKRKASKREPDFLDQAARFLKSKGWAPIVIGGITIEQPLGSLKYNYQLVVKFTGSRVTPKVTSGGKDEQ